MLWIFNAEDLSVSLLQNDPASHSCGMSIGSDAAAAEEHMESVVRTAPQCDAVQSIDLTLCGLNGVWAAGIGGMLSLLPNATGRDSPPRPRQSLRTATL